MILTNCAACAAPLAHDAPRCVRCKTRYCNATCQHDHWRRGHKQICKKIHRGGNAEQYYADKKYKEAVTEAVEACADDTKGQTCFICTQALHPRTGEGLVSGGCSCRGGSSFVHVSCLAEQAKISVEEAKEYNLASERYLIKWRHWQSCSLCGQAYTGVVAHALGWACWKTYCERQEGEFERGASMNLLAATLKDIPIRRYAESLSVFQSVLDMAHRIGVPEGNILSTEANIADCLGAMGRNAECLSQTRSVYSRKAKLWGIDHETTLLTATTMADSLLSNSLFAEAKAFSRKNIKRSTRALGPEHTSTLRFRHIFARALLLDPNASRADHAEAETELEDVHARARRVLGPTHPHTMILSNDLENLWVRQAKPAPAPS